jgi:hypothetical protein
MASGQGDQGRLDQVAEAAADMDPQVLLCRDLQHAWQAVHEQTDIEGGFERTLQCGRCTTRKRQVINSLGEYIGSPKYTYPDHYAAPGLKGLGPLTARDRGMLRLTALNGRHRRRRR